MGWAWNTSIGLAFILVIYSNVQESQGIFGTYLDLNKK